MPVTEYDIDKAYRVLVETKVNYENRLQAAIFVRWCRDLSFAKDISTGKLQGKNADERTANHRAMRQKLYRSLSVVEQEERNSKLNYDIASINVEKVRMMMRLMEVQANAGLRTDSLR